jgi:hypothetical protein
MAKPVPLTVTLVMLTLALPVLVSVRVWEAVLPAATVPKLTLVGPAVSATVEALACAVTGREAPTEEVLVMMATDPLKAPAALGVNMTVKLLLVPGLNNVDPENPLMLSPVPLATTPVTVSGAPPSFVNFKVWEVGAPTTAEVKLMLEGVTCNSGPAGAACALIPLGVETQPINAGTAATNTASDKSVRDLATIVLAILPSKKKPARLTHLSGQS